MFCNRQDTFNNFYLSICPVDEIILPSMKWKLDMELAIAKNFSYENNHVSLN